MKFMKIWACHYENYFSTRKLYRVASPPSHIRYVYNKTCLTHLCEGGLASVRMSLRTEA